MSNTHNIDRYKLLLNLFPTLFDFEFNTFHFKDKNIYPHDLNVGYNRDIFNIRYSVSSMFVFDEVFDNLEISLDYNLDEERYITSGLLMLKKFVDLSDDFCMNLFKYDITIMYPQYMYSSRGNIMGVEHLPYDRQVIERRHAINSIVNG